MGCVDNKKKKDKQFWAAINTDRSFVKNMLRYYETCLDIT